MRHLLLLLLCLLPLRGWAAGDSLIILAYHDVHARLPSGDNGISADQFILQLNWLQAHNYQPVSMGAVLAAAAGKTPLPAKPVLLTFDDGRANFYTDVLPILKTYGYPALLSVIGSKVGAPEYMNWAQITEASRSGLVEVAAHTHDLHHAVVANPQGNAEPAVISPVYDPARKRYESRAEYTKRLEDDTRRIVAALQRHTGRKPRVMVWPYGETNALAQSIATRFGMPTQLMLGDAPARLDQLGAMPRYNIIHNPTLPRFVSAIAQARATRTERPIHFDLTKIYDLDPLRQEKHLDALIDETYAQAANTVYLRVYDADEQGTLTALYFPNETVPMRGDLLNRVAWQLRVRTKANVVAVLPETLPAEQRARIVADLRLHAPTVIIQETAP